MPTQTTDSPCSIFISIYLDSLRSDWIATRVVFLVNYQTCWYQNQLATLCGFDTRARYGKRYYLYHDDLTHSLRRSDCWIGPRWPVAFLPRVVLPPSRWGRVTCTGVPIMWTLLWPHRVQIIDGVGCTCLTRVVMYRWLAYFGLTQPRSDNDEYNRPTAN